MGRFDGKVVIVTGGGGGIGREHALLFAREGAKVVVNDIGLRTGADAASVVAEIEAAGGSAIVSTDPATWDTAAAVVGTAVDAFGGVDILINNANRAGSDDLWKISEELWDNTVAVNLKGYHAMMAHAIPYMARNRWGAIVNTSSGGGFGLPSMSPFSLAKEGVIGLTRTAAKELGRFGITCNAIRPFAVGPSVRDYQTRVQKWGPLLAATMGAGASGDRDPVEFSPAKISPFVAWLCTDAARNVTGRTFHVSGDDVALYTEPTLDHLIHHDGGWTLDALDIEAPKELVAGLTTYTLDDHPELQVFEE